MEGDNSYALKPRPITVSPFTQLSLFYEIGKAYWTWKDFEYSDKDFSNLWEGTKWKT